MNVRSLHSYQCKFSFPIVEPHDTTTLFIQLNLLNWYEILILIILTLLCSAAQYPLLLWIIYIRLLFNWVRGGHRYRGRVRYLVTWCWVSLTKNWCAWRWTRDELRDKDSVVSILFSYNWGCDSTMDIICCVFWKRCTTGWWWWCLAWKCLRDNLVLSIVLRSCRKHSIVEILKNESSYRPWRTYERMKGEIMGIHILRVGRKDR
jgi:hypothetical protein